MALVVEAQMNEAACSKPSGALNQPRFPASASSFAPAPAGAGFRCAVQSCGVGRQSRAARGRGCCQGLAPGGASAVCLHMAPGTARARWDPGASSGGSCCLCEPQPSWRGKKEQKVCSWLAAVRYSVPGEQHRVGRMVLRAGMGAASLPVGCGGRSPSEPGLQELCLGSVRLRCLISQNQQPKGQILPMLEVQHPFPPLFLPARMGA